MSNWPIQALNSVALVVWLLLERRRLGAMIRAGVDDMKMACGVGRPLAGWSREGRQTVQALLAQISRPIVIVMIEHDTDTTLSFAGVPLLHYDMVILDGSRAEVVAHPNARGVCLGG